MISRFTRSFIVSCFALLLIGSLFFLNPPIRVYKDAITNEWFSNDGVEPYHPPKDSKEQNSHIGSVIMGKLGNETAKAQLGRATWKLLHTMTLRYPEKPTEDEREALKSYFYLSSRLYPCGECAAEFQLLLKENPPQTSSRKAASLWLCHVHNLVNKRLGKDIFDCNTLGDTYDCGCGDDPVEEKKKVPPVDLDGKPLIKGG
ncbi:FAD-linked sulfhydryl oxidase ERV2 [Serendipita indica DSM 11827]|nr:FAD-linked sulfhydryl oxidase ERV2 [Serendipita indica DSM 11827]